MISMAVHVHITVFAWEAVSGDFLGLQSDSNLVEVDALMALVRIARSQVIPEFCVALAPKWN